MHVPLGLLTVNRFAALYCPLQNLCLYLLAFRVLHKTMSSARILRAVQTAVRQFHTSAAAGGGGEVWQTPANRIVTQNQICSRSRDCDGWLSRLPQ